VLLKNARQTQGFVVLPRPKIFALVDDFCASLLTICLIRKNCENVIYFAMTCFIIVYILSFVFSQILYFYIFANTLVLYFRKNCENVIYFVKTNGQM
jgi:hypothetical protein